MSWDTPSQWGQYLATLGVPGLFAIALLDSAAIPIVGGPEALTMLLAWKQPAFLPLIVLAGALGATLGNYAFYRVGRAGGAVALSRLKARTQEWLKRQVTRHAFWALLVCVALPPPFPTKPLGTDGGRRGDAAGALLHRRVHRAPVAVLGAGLPGLPVRRSGRAFRRHPLSFDPPHDRGPHRRGPARAQGPAPENCRLSGAGRDPGRALGLVRARPQRTFDSAGPCVVSSADRDQSGTLT